MSMYVIILPATRGLKLPPQINHNTPRLPLKESLQLGPHIHHSFRALDIPKDFVGNRCVQQPTSGYLIPNTSLSRRDSADVASIGVRLRDSLRSEVVAQTPHLQRPLDAVMVHDPVHTLGR